ncbi:flagellar biosynthetic protein FliO [Rhodanobacter thiooxydans]|uniref:flagellar biosynthetic protein FliO n=1 Tax=Rhodanobacter thiooxydans TaxID=416169 RepID=UPI000AAFAE19|nr:flagellar biosynthetic protein FliO [Rhodanobacter thiooxydans]MCW0200564.1 flagellar biosynthetic protein FliO [Rhodanobacter thiooxydans]
MNREWGIGNRVVAALAPAALPAADVNVGGELFRVLLSLAAVVAMIFVAGWLSRRLQARSRPGGRRIRCVEAMAVGARDRVLLLDADGKRLLVGVGPGGMRTLHVYEGIPVEPAVAEPAAAPLPAFGELLARWKRGA